MDIEELLPSLRYLANRLNSNIFDDLVSEGVLRIYECQKTYKDLSSFKPYAIRDAWFAMLQFNELNTLIHVARSIRHSLKKGKYGEHTFKYESIRRTASMLCLEDTVCTIDEPYKDPDNLQDIIAKLDKRKRDLIALRYYDNLTMAETGLKLKITRQRVQQLEAEALAFITINYQKGKWR